VVIGAGETPRKARRLIGVIWAWVGRRGRRRREGKRRRTLTNIMASEGGLLTICNTSTTCMSRDETRTGG